MWLMFWPTIGSRLRHMQSDWRDTRFNNYILEHGYRWLLHAPGHHSLWSPPVFFPTPNTAAYSDILLGVAPLYWPWRFAGVPPDTAFQLWTMTIVSVNYVGALVCCRRLLRVNWVAASLGAFVFAFGSTRIAQVTHQQLLGQGYTLLACYALVRIFEEPGDEAARAATAGRRPLWIALAGASVVGQLYAAYYLGWFLGFTLAVGVACAAVLPDTRTRLLQVVRESWRVFLLTAAACALALVPFAVPYLRAAHDVGFRTYPNVTWYLPRVWSWIYMGRESWPYGWMFRYSVFRGIPEGHEHRLGVGLVTTALFIWGLVAARRLTAVRLMAVAALTVVVLCTMWPIGASAWVAVYRWVPGAAAIRGVSRIALVLLIPAGAGIALWAERYRQWPAVIAVAALVMVGEQAQRLSWYDKERGRQRVAVIAAAIPAGCDAFLYTPPTGRDNPWAYHVDAMWASIQTGVPTVNGYTGNAPPTWEFYWNAIVNPAHDRAIEISLLRWELTWSLGTTRICRVETSPIG